MSTLPLPSLFVSHGAPLFATDPGTTGPALHAWATEYAPAAQLKGIVIMSPHWMARAPTVMSTAAPETWHDFGGFPPELYQLQYPAPGSPALAAQVAELLAAANISAPLDTERPFDHGAWVPLMHMYPQADVPVVQLALPQGWGPAQVLALGRALQPLRAQGVLVMGSGSMTHNLREFFNGDREPTPYVTEFSRWIENAISRGDVPALLDYTAQAPNAQRAHPSDDHFLPLFFALGAAGESFKADYISREVRYGMLAMDAVALQ
jgi:4,5-DOPA dioxygenase extradiol